MSADLAPDLEGTLQLFAEGRRTPAASGYRPHHVIHENYWTTGIITFLDRELASPGDTLPVAVKFITPEVYPRCIWEGRDISVQEADRKIGILTVTRILNESLRVAPGEYSPIWVKPPGLKERA